MLQNKENGDKTISLNDFILDLKENMDNITRGDLQGVIEARCLTTGESCEKILQILDRYQIEKYK